MKEAYEKAKTNTSSFMSKHKGKFGIIAGVVLGLGVQAAVTAFKDRRQSTPMTGT